MQYTVMRPRMPAPSSSPGRSSKMVVDASTSCPTGWPSPCSSSGRLTKRSRERPGGAGCRHKQNKGAGGGKPGRSWRAGAALAGSLPVPAPPVWSPPYWEAAALLHRHLAGQAHAWPAPLPRPPADPPSPQAAPSATAMCCAGRWAAAHSPAAYFSSCPPANRASRARRGRLVLPGAGARASHWPAQQWRVYQSPGSGESVR